MVDIYILIRYSMFLATNCETHKICHSWPSFQPPGVGLDEPKQREQRERRTGLQGVVLVEFDEIEAHISSSLVWTEISLI